MPRVPIYQQQVETVNPQEQIPSFRPPAEMGQAINASMEAVKNYGETVGRVENLLAQRIADHNEMAAQVNVTNHDSAFRVEMQNLLSNEDGSGYLDRKLDNASGVTQEFDKNYEQLKTKYLDSVDSDYQKGLLARSMDDHYASTRNQVIKHESNEFRDSYNTAMESNIKLRAADAANIKDPVALGNAIAQLQIMKEEMDKKNGLDDNTIELNKKAIAGEMAKASINAIVEDNPVAARSLFNSVKETMNPIQKTELENTIKGKEIHLKDQATWESLKNYTLADGSSDLSKMQDAIYNSNKYSPEEKDRLFSYVKLRANEHDAILKDQEQQNTNLIIEQISDDKNNKVPVDESVKKAVALASTSSKKLRVQRLVEEIYKNEVPQDPSKYMNSWYAIKEGTMTRDKLFSELDKGNLNATSWKDLSKELYEQETKGDNGVKKLEWDRVKLLAEKEYSDKQDRDAFMYVVHSYSPGKTPDEIYNFALKRVENDPTSGIFGNGIFGTAQYQIDLENKNQQTQKVGELENTYGTDMVNKARKALIKNGLSTDPQYIEMVLKRKMGSTVKDNNLSTNQ